MTIKVTDTVDRLETGMLRFILVLGSLERLKSDDVHLNGEVKTSISCDTSWFQNRAVATVASTAPVVAAWLIRTISRSD